MTAPASPPDPTPRPNQSPMKILYWIAAVAMAIALVLEMREPPVDYLKVASRVALLLALVLLATARPAETKAKKGVIYALVVFAAVMLVIRLVL